ncbi:Uncharacterized conserved protein [Desulfonatronum thiosulfatophilum]|uniref:Uncharacterized conserved protein n=1 Tax=Desulfonatronum thiosulfatophilum TaxID=617002 RepID=A0A1G6DK86_9BACT|nr:RimK/LysX family protein [Desulfonatronum thiosulfatophilum]SDB45245.1 Uncharacterized conserved protein [Desulfonatronum thiosulfatophilum]
MRFPILPVALLLCLLLTGVAQADDTDVRTIHGWIERIEVLPEGISLKARMDTGATISSLNALNKQYFRRDGKRWIAFDIIDPEDPENFVRIERPLIRHIRIVRHDGDFQRRPVVSIGLCIGPHYREEEMSLIDRTQLLYQALVGRNHMRGIILVDSAETFLHRPNCLPASDVPEESDADDFDPQA